MKNRKKFFILILIILIAIIFRFYNYSSLQYWSGDEEIDSAVVRKMIVEKRIVLVHPNATIATSLGSFFEIFSVPLFIISQLNPIKVYLLMGIFSLATTILLYKIGVLVKNKRLGYIFSFLYGASFLMGMFDRRWWSLNLNPFFSTLAVFSLLQIIIKKKYFYSITLALPVGFAFHADPSLAIILLVIILSYFYFRQKLLRKEHLFAGIIVVIFLLPLVFFEIRHPGTILNPLLKNLGNRKIIMIDSSIASLKIENAKITLSTLSKLFFPKPTNFAENYFCYNCSSDEPLFGTWAKIITLFLIIYPFFILRKIPDKEKKLISILLIFILSFVFNSLLYTIFFKKWLYQSYFTIIFPVIFLLVGYTLLKLTEKKKVILLFIFLFYFLINSQALIYSKLRYPLSVKEKLVTEISGIIGQKNFSLYSLGNEYFYGGGYRGLFILQNRHPKKSNTYSLFGWWYETHGLYTTKIENIDQEIIVIISPSSSHYSFDKSKIIYQKSFDNIQGIVLNNTNGWFDESIVNKP